MSAADQTPPYVRKAASQEGLSPVAVPAAASAPSHVTNEIAPAYQPHSGERSQCVDTFNQSLSGLWVSAPLTQLSFCRYLRDVILGVNDGLVSMFLLILGVRYVPLDSLSGVIAVRVYSLCLRFCFHS
jgi:hypothetical protein